MLLYLKNTGTSTVPIFSTSDVSEGQCVKSETSNCNSMILLNRGPVSNHEKCTTDQLVPVCLGLRPSVFDVNSDGIPDLITGTHKGTLLFWRGARCRVGNVLEGTVVANSWKLAGIGHGGYSDLAPKPNTAFLDGSMCYSTLLEKTTCGSSRPNNCASHSEVGGEVACWASGKCHWSSTDPHDRGHFVTKISVTSLSESMKNLPVNTVVTQGTKGTNDWTQGWLKEPISGTVGQPIVIEVFTGVVHWGTEEYKKNNECGCNSNSNEEVCLKRCADPKFESSMPITLGSDITLPVAPHPPSFSLEGEITDAGNLFSSDSDSDLSKPPTSASSRNHGKCLELCKWNSKEDNWGQPVGTGFCGQSEDRPIGMHARLSSLEATDSSNVNADLGDNKFDGWPGYNPLTRNSWYDQTLSGFGEEGGSYAFQQLMHVKQSASHIIPKDPFITLTQPFFPMAFGQVEDRSNDNRNHPAITDLDGDGFFDLLLADPMSELSFWQRGLCSQLTECSGNGLCAVSTKGGGGMRCDLSLGNGAGTQGQFCAGGYLEETRKGGATLSFISKPSCIKCEKGKWSNETGRIEKFGCLACEVGRFNDQTGSTMISSCQKCPAGWSSSLPSSAACVRCSAGFAGPKEGMSNCVECPVGSFTNRPKQIVCSQCDTGSSTSLPGSTRCESCIPGTAGSSCSRCVPGKYRGLEDKPSGCIGCPSGYSTDDRSGLSECLRCDAGSFALSASAPLCANCPEGYYQDDRGKDACKASATCKEGKVPNNVRTQCEKASWAVPADCKLGSEYLDVTESDKYLHACTRCPNGGDCTAYSDSTTLRHRKGYWSIPWGTLDRPFAECPYPNQCGVHNCTGNARNDSIVCAACADNHFRAADSSCVPCDQVAGDTAATLGPLIGVGLLLLVAVVCLRKRLKMWRDKYGVVWRDALRILTINLSYAQINASLPSIIRIQWPVEYLEWLERMDFVEFDLTSVLGLGCVAGGMDYRLRVSLAVAVPAFVVLVSAALHFVAEIESYTTPHETGKARGKAAEFLFDIMDGDETGVMDVDEFKQLLVQMHQPVVETEEVERMMASFGARNDRKTRKILLARKTFLQAASHHEVGKVLGEHWIDRALVKRSDNERGASVMFLLFTFHAPVSQRLFYYLDCHTINGRSFLREDYDIECFKGEFVV